jgi:hypothetical protein
MRAARWGIAGGAGLVAGVFVACSFPEIEFTASSSSSSSGSGGAGQGGASTSASSTSSSASSASTTSTGPECGEECSQMLPCATSHDRDCDGHGNMKCGIGGAGAGGEASYDDCDDCDPNVFGGQAEYFPTERDAGVGYDYNCDGDQEHQYESITCGGGPVGLEGCGTMDVFLTGMPVNCGVLASFGDCGGLPCGTNNTQDKRQECR